MREAYTYILRTYTPWYVTNTLTMLDLRPLRLRVCARTTLVMNSNYNCITAIRASRGAVPSQRKNKLPNGRSGHPDSTRRSTLHNVQGTYRRRTVPTVLQFELWRKNQGWLPTFARQRHFVPRRVEIYLQVLRTPYSVYSLRSQKICLLSVYQSTTVVHQGQRNNSNNNNRSHTNPLKKGGAGALGTGFSLPIKGIRDCDDHYGVLCLCLPCTFVPERPPTRFSVTLGWLGMTVNICHTREAWRLSELINPSSMNNLKVSMLVSE